MGVISITALVALGSGSIAFVKATSAAPKGRWSAPVTLFRVQGATLPAISCASVHLCIAVGAKGLGLTAVGLGLSGATAWSSPPIVIDNDGGLTAASCPPAGPCVAAGAGFGVGGNTYRFFGGKWSAGPRTAVSFDSVSCPTAHFCAAVGFLNYASAFIFNGKSWSSQIPISAPGFAISCPTSKFCAAVSESGDVIYDKNGTWSKATSIDRYNPDSISCASARFCVAVDGSGDALSDVNGRWSKPATVDIEASLFGVSCPTTTFCVAVDTAGAVLFYNGSRWSSPQTVSKKIEFTSISCPTVNFCAAVGLNNVQSGTVAYVATYAATS
jgi:hypothetical protein